MRTFAKLSIISTAMIITTTAFAADPMMQYNTKQTNSDIQKLEKFEYHEGETLEEYLSNQPKGNLYSSEEEVLSVLMGGVNSGDYRKEPIQVERGLMLRHCTYGDHMVSGANWFPRTEEVQPDRNDVY
eukprot:TRINITY_DN6520_c0_g1_i1.p1 TRINITY_DN6520_c0_g1~~TRINITY_DN6520_c0_g1_i1.p1  ORF type:complete len:128 (+),score=22.15 TRINITY_DN6520_c0_g1_i1:66-449(+)